MGENLTPEKFPFPDKCSDICEDWYLEKVHQYVIDEAQGAISWYMGNKESNRRWSKRIRFFTILFIAIGGIMPLIAALEIPLHISNWNDSKYIISQFGFIALAIAGSLLLFDRSFGFTSSWVRFITAATNIQKLITEFDSSYILNLCLKTNDQRRKGQLDCIMKFIVAVRGEIVKESAEWAAEYSSNLAMLEGILKNEQGNKKP